MQCLNGAYLSEVSDDLGEILLGPDYSGRSGGRRPIAVNAATGEQIAAIKLRIGQGAFSFNVRQNYRDICCFPGCDVRDSTFLIGAHIDRWADDSAHRGATSNGLCLCLMHDKAFETGLFTLTEAGLVSVNTGEAESSEWAKKHLLPFSGKSISSGKIKPSAEALRKHWQRIGYSPS